MELVTDLLEFVDAAPSPYHATAQLGRRLEGSGYTRLEERDRWSVRPGERFYVVRDGGSIAAVQVGKQPASDAGFRLVGAHTDSPTLKVRPRADVRREGYRLVGVEPYGAPLLHTWLDRDLTIAGRVSLRQGDRLVTRLIHLAEPVLRVPSLAIHLNREINREGLKVDPQRHLTPLWDLEGEDDRDGLREAVAAQLAVQPADVLAWDLVTADCQPATLGGASRSFVFAPRMDNLASCHAGVAALLDCPPAPQTMVFIANDHEEVGSASAEGAAGSFLEDVLRRVVSVTEDGDPQTFAMACARSWLVSADAAHAVHPNHGERHEPEHRPRLGGGPVLKVNANQAYATDAGSAAWFAARCADAKVPLQQFVTRADMPCGSTIGPLTATRLGIPTVDVGSPLLSMHSCREQTAAEDHDLLVAALRAHLLTTPAPEAAG